MSVLWRYLLGQYIKVLSLATVAFLTILFVSKLKRIAQFATLGGEGMDIFLFAAYLVPYVLPLSLPISCLISSILLFQRMSQTQELTAMRSCGLALRQITGPILIAGAILSVGSFFVISELATQSRLTAKLMRSEIASINPLSLLQNTQLLRLGELFVDMRTVTSGEEVEDVVIALHNSGMDRIQLVAAKELYVGEDELSGSNVALISSATAKKEGQFDHLLIENQRKMEAPLSSFRSLIRQTSWSLDPDHLPMRLLLVQLKNLRGDAAQIHRCISELFKRVSLATAVFSFTLLGCSFGIDLNRFRRKRRLIYVLLLSGLFLTCYSMAKGYLGNLYLSAALLFLPQVLIILFSIGALKRITVGDN